MLPYAKFLSAGSVLLTRAHQRFPRVSKSLFGFVAFSLSSIVLPYPAPPPLPPPTDFDGLAKGTAQEAFVLREGFFVLREGVCKVFCAT